MPEPFAITTADPRFSPNKPVLVNGYVYLSAADLAAWCRDPRNRSAPILDPEWSKVWNSAIDHMQKMLMEKQGG